MSIKKWLAAAALIAASTGAVFANGTVDDDDYRHGGRNSGRNGGPRGEMNYEGYEDIETRTVTGAFTMVDGEYPAIITEEGETLYLMIHARIEDIPEEGADLVLEAFQAPMSPVHLMVVSAEVDGVALELDDDHGPGDRGGRYGGGMHGGSEMSGGKGAKPGWGYEDSLDD